MSEKASNKTPLNAKQSQDRKVFEEESHSHKHTSIANEQKEGFGIQER